MSWHMLMCLLWVAAYAPINVTPHPPPPGDSRAFDHFILVTLMGALEPSGFAEVKQGPISVNAIYVYLESNSQGTCTKNLLGQKEAVRRYCLPQRSSCPR